MAVAEVSLRFKDPALLCIFKLSTLTKYTLCCLREVWLLRLKKWSKFEAGAWPIIGMKTGVAKVDISSLVDITALPLNPPYFDIFPLIITSAGGGAIPSGHLIYGPLLSLLNPTKPKEHKKVKIRRVWGRCC